MEYDEINILQPNDFHHHFRDGQILKDTVMIASQTFNYVIAMPNLNPPINNFHKAKDYFNRIIRNIPSYSNMKVLMTIYLVLRLRGGNTNLQPLWAQENL